MSSRRTVALLLLIVSLAFVLIGIFGRDSGGGGTAAGAGPSADEAPAPRPAELAAARPVADDTPAAAEPLAAAPRPAAGAARVSAEAAEAGGRVLRIALVAPSASPADETLAVLVVAPRRGETLSDGAEEQLRRTDPRGLVAWLEEEERPGEWWSHVLAPAGGAPLELALPAACARAWVLVDGRYLYLDEAREVELAEDATDVLLEPRVGAWLTGRCVLPAGAAARGVDADRFEASVSLTTFDMGGGRRWFTRERELDGVLEFEYRGLPGEERYALAVTAERLAPYSALGVGLEAGQHDAREVPLELGGTIRGRVHDAAGAGIAGAKIDPSSGNRFWFGSKGREVTSEEDGTYALYGVAPGEITLDVAHEDWLDTESEELQIAEGQVLDGVDFELERGHSLAGRVLWPDGQPVDGARVSARRPRDRDVPWRGLDGAASTTTDADGSFELLGLVEGPFSVRARHEVLVDEDGRTVEVDPDEAQVDGEDSGEPDGPSIRWRAELEGVAENTRDLELVLVEPGGVAGVVRDDAGAPVTAFEIVADPAGENPMWGASLDRVQDEFESEDGSFVLRGLHPGGWSLTAVADGYARSEEGVPVTVSADAPAPGEAGEPVELVLVRAARIAGVVLDPTGREVAGAEVATQAGGGAGNRWDWYAERRTAETDEEGRFELENVPVVAALSLVASSEDWADSESLPVELQPGAALVDLVLALRQGGRIVGEVYDEAGDPVVGRSVGISENGFDFGFGGEGRETTDAAGHFAFEHVTPGTWVVTAGPSQEEMFEKMQGASGPEDFMDMLSDTLTARAEVTDGQETHVRLGATPKRLVRVHGRVTKAGAPVADQTIMAFAEGTSFLSGMEAGRTDEDGWYELTVDRPGSYVVGLQGWSGGDEVEFPVEVPEADELRFDLVLPLGEIRGRVLGPDGKPLEDVGVRLTREDGALALGSLGGGTREETDENGAFTFGTLWPGTYSLRAGGTGGFDMGGGATWGTAIVGGVAVAENQSVAGVVLSLEAPGKIVGVVRDAEGTPAAGASIHVRDSAGRLLSSVSTTTSDAAGRFEYGGVTPGDVTVSARTGELATPATAVRVTAGEEASVELVLEPATLLVVTAEDESDETLSVGVSVVDEEGREYASMLGERAFSELFSEGFSSRERKVGPLPPGRYKVTVTTLDGRTATKPVRLKGREERKLRLRIRD